MNRYTFAQIPRSRCFSLQDVALQMDAKLWGEEFNRHNPPKKVDIFMMAVIELIDRPGNPLFHVEHYIGTVSSPLMSYTVLMVGTYAESSNLTFRAFYADAEMFSKFANIP